MRSLRRIPIEWITAPALLVALIAIWQVYVVRFAVSAFILPPPMAVWRAFLDLLATPSTWTHTLVTVEETLAGFAVAAIGGVGLGVVVGKFGWLERTLNPFIVASQVVPKVALVPLFIVWFGFGSTSKIVIAAVIAFFPVFANAVLGVKSVESGHRDVMTCLNASAWQRFVRLDLPSSLPAILAGMEVGVVLAIIGCVVAQFLGGNAGLGYLLVAKMNAYETDSLFAVIVLLTLVGFVFYAAVGLARRLLIPWHQSATSR
jgi:NitT/TauT family transport system permease protein